VMAVMLCVAAVPAMAQSELDQSQPDFLSQQWVTNELDKQTFTAQKTGTLDSVWVVANCVQSSCRDPFFTSVTFEIGGTQSAPIVGEFAVDQCGVWCVIDLSGAAPFVEAGKQYEIKLSASNPGVQFGGASSDVYPGGEFSAWDGLDWSTRSDFELAFQTYVTPDTTAPKVDSEKPAANGTEGVARNTNVTATFSERMDPDTLSTSTFKLFKVNKNGTTSRITNAPVKLSADALTAKLNPFGSSDTRLAKNTRYKAVVTTGATDVAGNALDQDDARAGNQQKVWYFTTGTT